MSRVAARWRGPWVGYGIRRGEAPERVASQTLTDRRDLPGATALAMLFTLRKLTPREEDLRDRIFRPIAIEAARTRSLHAQPAREAAALAAYALEFLSRAADEASLRSLAAQAVSRRYDKVSAIGISARSVSGPMM